MIAGKLRRGRPLTCPGLLALVTASACVVAGCAGGRQWVAVGHSADEVVRLSDAEQLIDELDRTLTANGTIGVKSPDVWGQDRLAKFRSEYEAEMAEWLKYGFKGEINATSRRGESESRRVQAGVGLSEAIAKESASRLPAMPAAEAAPAPPAPGGVTLEPTVVLDEHSNYLNHLNQLRRINAGDDLADRPGYGLYLVRIPVTLSPGPRSRRGKGAIITVSARSVMTKETLRATLRNAVINETVTNLTQALCGDPAEDGDPTMGRGVNSFSLVSYADTEIIYGKPEVALLRAEVERQLTKDLIDEPHHRSARIAQWLKAELESTYHLLEQTASPVRTSGLVTIADPLEEIGELLAARDYGRLALLPRGPMPDPAVLRAAGGAGEVAAAAGLEARRRHVTGLLGFALRIQAAAVNRRLKQDMSDHDHGLRRDDLRGISLFEPNASDEALKIFEKYVESKWPLRVYAIEPVIAQQNVADAVGRRMLSSVDLTGAGPAGPLKLLGGLSFDRRLTDEETAIRLNPTMVGFGAGESTFGWVFYPRLQTGPGPEDRLRGNLALLLDGRLPDRSGREQSIEPGQRECTALIEMPNFIPKIEFVTVANWFRTSDVGDGQKSDLEKASYLASRLVDAEKALHRVMLSGKYRREEVQIAQERLNQIRSMMPTQSLTVRVPFSAEHNDARIFCSQSDQLRPALVAWHGKPPEEGEESTLFLEGKNFSVHDTHVLAGGRPARSILISRNLLQVTIDAEATPTASKDGRPLLNINVATPNGVSNHMLLPMQPPNPERKKAKDRPAGPATAATSKPPAPDGVARPARLADARKPAVSQPAPAASPPATAPRDPAVQPAKNAER